MSIFAGQNSVNHQKKIKEFTQLQKVYKVKLRNKCRYSSAYFAQLHTQNEWSGLKNEQEFKDEFALLCPKGIEILDTKEMKVLHRFANEYALGSGQYPPS